MKRLLPVLNKLGTRTRVPLSIDTTKAVVAAAALDQGAAIINDISALGDPLMGPLVASRRAGLILMHRQGTSETMQCNPTYPGEDVVAAVSKYLSERRDAALGFGVDAAAIILDPGLGFGKTLDHNLALLRGLPLLAKLGSPLLIGHSRKSFLGAALGIKEPSDRLSAGLAVTCFARAAGAWLFRVHDVRPHREALQMSEVLE
jgi:dihydropteroate synthase